MPAHDIIDNRSDKLVDHLNGILGTAEAAKMAVGYFFLSGFGAVREKLSQLKSIRILIGNTSNRETIEQLSEACKRLELVQAAEEKERFQTKAIRRQRAEETARNLRQTIERMDQTDAEQGLVHDLIRLVEEKRLQVKVYTKGRLHAKAYIFDYPQPAHYESGIAIVGSSNLTLSGLTHNTELNVVVHGSDNHAQLCRWFEELWADAHDFDSALMEELRQSWAAAVVKPYDIYMKTLYALVADRLDEEAKAEILWDDEITRALADFQKAAVRSAVQMIRDYGGAFVSDVVGLGKSYIGAGILKYFHHRDGSRPLIICPKTLEEMWRDYSDTYDLGAVILPMSLLQKEGENGKSVLDEKKYQDRDFVLVDESHNFRHHSSQRYEVLQSYLMRGMKKVCLLTATPRNRSATDVYNQIKLFHPDDITPLPIDPPNLKEYFKQIEHGSKKLQDLLIHILIRRTRRHILRWYGYAGHSGTPLRELSDSQAQKYFNGEHKAYVMVAGRHQYFPKRELETLRYSIEETYTGLYDDLRQYLGRPAGKRLAPKPGTELTYARYGLWHYVLPGKQNVEPYRSLHRAGVNLRGLIRVMLFKRFESSVEAFRETLQRLHRIHQLFLDMLEEGIVPAGEESQRLLYESDNYEDAELADQLRALSGRYKIEDFNADLLRKHIKADHDLIHKMLDLVKPITPAKDAKLQVLLAKLKSGIPQKTGKVLVFTQFADTARYLYDNLNPGGKAKDIDSIYGTDKSKARMAARFAPLANPHISLRESDPEIRILVATDVMSEGLNLQDGDVVVNYDLHWNPVRLIQRFGRIDRIGSENDTIWGFNFLPETKLDRNLGLINVLRARIAEIHSTIGEDAAILDRDEQLNEEAMFAIYEKKSGQSSFYEDAEGDFVDLNEAEELLRTIRKEDPAEFERIANLRDGIRSARAVFSDPAFYVFCQAGRFQQLMLTAADGTVASRDITTVINRIKCGRKEPAALFPADHNARVMKIKEIFAEEVKHRLAQQQYTLNLTVQQRYALRELRAFYTLAEDDDIKSKINVLEAAFKHPLSKAINRQLNIIRRNGMTGQNLVRALGEIYLEHNMAEHDFLSRIRTETESEGVPRIMCSEALV
jgi:hypothetical protein